MVDQIHLQMRAMQALSKSQDMTADNLANLNTPGFKGSKIFYELYTEELDGKKNFPGSTNANNRYDPRCFRGYWKFV